MNRRAFFSAAAKAAFGFAILPSAVTYARQWKPLPSGIVAPRWIPMPPEMWDTGLFRPVAVDTPAFLIDWRWETHKQLNP